jgi:hypothetical protein
LCAVVLTLLLAATAFHARPARTAGNPAAIWFVGLAVVASALLGLVYLRARTRPTCNYAGFGPFWLRIVYCLAMYVL